MYKSDLVSSEIRKAFSQSANTYDKAALIQREIAQRLFERLHLMRINPEIIVDLGAGTGFCSGLLEKKYPEANILSVDISQAMLFEAKYNKQWSKNPNFLCADAEFLPLKTQSVDLIFSSLFLHWSFSLEHVIAELQRILKPNGLLLFSMLGPDTFKEMRQSWAVVDNNPHVHSFIDMHEVGDILLHSHMADPVMDMEYITLYYEKVKTIFTDIKAQGVSNKLKERQKTLTGKQRFQNFVKQYELRRNQEGKLPVTYEVIYGHAWGVELQELEDENVVYISPEMLRNRK